MAIVLLQNTFVAAGYAIFPGVTELYIDVTAGVGGSGVHSSTNVTIVNYGQIHAESGAEGIDLSAAGVVFNKSGGAVSGKTGVEIDAAGAYVANRGQISGDGGGTGVGYGVALLNVGVVANQVAGATIYGKTSGVLLAQGGEVFNYGTILSTQDQAVELLGAGTIVNGAAGDGGLISGGQGVGAFGLATIDNYGVIRGVHGGGVRLEEGGTVNNGVATDPTAQIQASDYGVWSLSSGTVTNYGTITGVSQSGVELSGGGAVTNGGLSDQTSLIAGGDGIYAEVFAATVTNFGAVIGRSSTGVGAALGAGGGLVNGANGDTSARIFGATGVRLGSSGSVVNYGGIVGAAGCGVSMVAGGTVTNGGLNDTQARIDGATYGLSTGSGSALIANFGVIVGRGASQSGVDLSDGGVVTNGALTDLTATITGANGVTTLGANVLVTNLGLIHGAGGQGAAYSGVYLNTGGTVVNGAVIDTSARIDGYNGVVSNGGATTIANLGVIAGLGAGGAYGVSLSQGGSVTNGTAKDAKAIIEGYAGLGAAGAATVTNFGTILGAGGTALIFGAAADRLIVEAGSVFEGQVLGGGGTLELANGTGTLTGLLAGGNVTVSASMPTTTFSDFDMLQVDAGASFNFAGGGKIGAGQSLIDAGTLSGTGILAIVGGSATFNAGARLSTASVTVSSGSTMTDIASLSYSGKWTQVGGTLSVRTGATATFTGANDSFAGSLAGAGTVALTAGADTLSATTLTAAHVKLAGAAVTLSGAIANASAVALNGGSVTVAATGATLYGAGAVTLSNSAANVITGATSAATLNVGQVLKGAGDIGAGQMILVTTVAGLIESTTSTALIIDTGASTIANAGKIVSAGAGGTMVKSAVDNTGRLIASSGVLTLTDAVTGAGAGQVAAGTLRALSSFAENVSFTAAATGAFELAQSQGYLGTISGFSTASKTFLDLDDIAFDAATTKASYVGTTTKGILTVTDGTHTAKIHFTGDYAASNWVLASDGHGGTLVHDAVTTPVAAAHAFVQAVAGLTPAPSAAAGHGAVESWRPSACLLANHGQPIA